MAKRKSRFVSEAALQALVRFGPETSGLTELQRQAEENLRTAVGQARGTSRGIVAAVDRARPEIAGIYDDAGLTQARTAQTLMGRDLAGLSNVADSIKAGASLEAAGMAGRLNEARAASLDELANRRVQAREGEQFAVQNARGDFVKDIAKILQRKQDLAREQGAFTASTAGQLRESARDRATRLSIEQMGNSQSERNSIRSAGIDPDTMEPIPNGKLDPKPKKGDRPRLPGGAKLATPETHGRVRDKVQLGLQQAKSLKAAGLERNEVAPMLVQGVPAAKDRAGVKSIPELYASVALDVAYDGHVSHRNAELLHRRGLSLKGLGYRTATAEERKRAQAEPWMRSLARALGG